MMWNENVKRIDKLNNVWMYISFYEQFDCSKKINEIAIASGSM